MVVRLNQTVSTKLPDFTGLNPLVDGAAKLNAATIEKVSHRVSQYKRSLGVEYLKKAAPSLYLSGIDLFNHKLKVKLVRADPQHAQSIHFPHQETSERHRCQLLVQLDDICQQYDHEHPIAISTMLKQRSDEAIMGILSAVSTTQQASRLRVIYGLHDHVNTVLNQFAQQQFAKGDMPEALKNLMCAYEYSLAFHRQQIGYMILFYDPQKNIEAKECLAAIYKELDKTLQQERPVSLLCIGTNPETDLHDRHVFMVNLYYFPCEQSCDLIVEVINSSTDLSPKDNQYQRQTSTGKKQLKINCAYRIPFLSASDRLNFVRSFVQDYQYAPAHGSVRLNDQQSDEPLSVFSLYSTLDLYGSLYNKMPVLQSPQKGNDCSSEIHWALCKNSLNEHLDLYKTLKAFYLQTVYDLSLPIPSQSICNDLLTSNAKNRTVEEMRVRILERIASARRHLRSLN